MLSAGQAGGGPARVYSLALPTGPSASDVGASAYPSDVGGSAGSSGGRLTLLFFTDSFPYDIGKEQTFLEPQMPHLQASFDRVVIIPSRIGGSRVSLPGSTEVDEGLARVLGSTRPLDLVVRALTSRLFWADVRDRPGILRSRQAMRRLIGTSARAEMTRAWLAQRLRRADPSPDATVACSVWFDHATAGLGLVRRKQRDLVVVTRINGADLFEERHSPPYLPCRRSTLAQLDRVYAVSGFGMRYLLERHPWFAPRCELARLGVRDPGFITPPPAGGRFVVVSCSGLVPVKRVDRILEGIGQLARKRPGATVEWHHFGDGEESARIQLRALAELPGNARATFHGHLTIQEILDFYRSVPVAAFINTSESEGGSPVAIMEAASCGIPVIATAVGGNPEIVTEHNGVLLSADPSWDEIADAFIGLIDDPDGAAAKRIESRRMWEQRFVAEVNYEDFARRLRLLRAA